MTQSELEEFEAAIIDGFNDIDFQIHSQDEIILGGIFTLDQLNNLAIAILKNVKHP